MELQCVDDDDDDFVIQQRCNDDGEWAISDVDFGCSGYTCPTLQRSFANCTILPVVSIV